jgi:cytochrome c-type biogenesis protein CcsB
MLSTVSDRLIVSAVVLYGVAMLAFAVELATWSPWPSRRRAAAASTPRARVAAVVPADLPAPSFPIAEETSRSAGAPEAIGSPTSRRAARTAVILTGLGWVLHVGSVLTRGLAAGRVPWGNMYEFSSAICLSAVTVFLVVQRRRQWRRLGLFVMLPVLAGLGLATTVLYTPVGPLVPALHSYWLVIHVPAAITASGLFTVASVLAGLYLLRTGRKQTGALARAVRAVVPSAEELDELCFRLIAIAFPIWTFAVVAGAIWADKAWGRYWGWDPKETWAFITWVIYAAYLHARVTAGWRGRKAAALAMVGAAAITFNYFGVNMWIVGLHSYAGVK